MTRIFTKSFCFRFNIAQFSLATFCFVCALFQTAASRDLETQPPMAKETSRTWQINSEKIVGAFLHIKGDQVFVEESSGTIRALAVDDLSRGDKAYVKMRSQMFNKYLASNHHEGVETNESKSLPLSILYLIFGICIFVAGSRLYLQTSDLEFRMAIIVITFSGSSLFFVAAQDEGLDQFVASSLMNVTNSAAGELTSNPNRNTLLN
jgi:hypothetical protein